MRVVMISVDAERDSAAALKEYLQHFSGEFIGLTGDPQRIHEYRQAVLSGLLPKGT